MLKTENAQNVYLRAFMNDDVLNTCVFSIDTTDHSVVAKFHPNTATGIINLVILMHFIAT